MLKNPIKTFSKSRAMVMAGYNSADAKTSSLLSILTSIDPELSFFGTGGPLTKSHPSFTNYGDITKAEDKIFHPHLNGEIDINFYLYPWMLLSNINTQKVMSKLTADGFFSQFEGEKGREVDMMFTMNNTLLSNRIYQKVNSIYEKEGQLKPFAIHMDRTSRKFKYSHHEFLDYFVYTTNLEPINPTGFRFPGKFIGKQVVFDAFKFLLKNSTKFSELASDSVLYLSPKLNSHILEEVVFDLRKDFRTRHNIPESATLFFISLGNTEEEMNGNYKAVGDGLKCFRDNHITSRHSKDDFRVVLNITEKNQKTEKVISYLLEAGIDIELVVGEKDRYAAMAASDLGAVANGDAVLEASAFQLPTVILDHSGFTKSYRSLLFNVYENELNIQAEGQVLPEMLGRNFGRKLNELWEEWYDKPKKRYRLAEKTSRYLLELLPRPEEGGEVMVGGNVFAGYSCPDKELTMFTKKALQDYRELKDSNINPREFNRRRDNKIGLGFD